MPCVGCLSNLQPPTTAPFSYKLNELFIRGIQQGVMPLLLTILLLSFPSRASFLFVPGVEVHRGHLKADIDLLVAASGHLILVECKDLEQGSPPDSITGIIGQLKTNAQIACELGAEAVFLSTLLDEAPSELRRGVKEIAGRYRDIVIQLVLGPDLDRGYLSKPVPAFLTPGISAKEIPMSLADILPKARSDKRDWIREAGERKVSF